MRSKGFDALTINPLAIIVVKEIAKSEHVVLSITLLDIENNLKCTSKVCCFIFKQMIAENN